MRIPRSEDFLILLVLFSISFILFSIPVFLNGGRLFSTDQEIFIKGAENIRTRFSIIIPSPLNYTYQTSIIDSHGTPYVSKYRGGILKYPPGQSIILALLITFVPNYNLIECFIAAWGIILFYFLVKRLLGKQKALFCTLTLMFTPVYYFYSMFAMADMTAFVILLLTIIIYLKAKETNKITFYILCSLLLGATVWLKYINTILIVPFFVHYLITRKKGEKLLPAFTGFLVFCMCIIGLLFYHKWAFDGFFTTGYTYNEVTLSENVSGGIITLLVRQLLSFPIKELMIKLTNFPIHIAICSPLTLLGVFGCFFLTREQWRKFSLLLLISLAILLFYATFATNTFGSEHYNRSTFSSYNRYMLPTYCLLMIPAASLFRNLSTQKLYMVLVFITTINLFSLCFATINLTNLHWELAHQKETYQLREKHLGFTTDESIIIGEHVVFYMVNTNRHIIEYSKNHLKSSRFQNEFHRVVHALIKDGHDVYLVQDSGEETNIENVVFEVIDGETSLYKLSRK